MRERVLLLQSAVAQLPQVETPTFHHFADGMYLREQHIPAGTVIVGKIHKKEHFFILAKGQMQVTGDDGVKTLTAPAIFCGRPGSKRAGYAHTDCVVLNVHKTNSTDIDEIEAEVIEPESDALLDAHNRIKELT